jgi:predicted TIM-barrel fold metal-dependent hydrolase
MRIVDSQVHIWGPNTPERPWPARHKAQREIPLGHEELLRLMDEAGVDGAVLVPPSWEGERNDLVQAAVREHPRRFCAVGRVAPDSADVPGQLARLAAVPGMLGLRFSMHRPEVADSLDGGGMDVVFREAERNGLAMMLLLPQKTMLELEPILQRHPGMKVILDHIGIPSSVPAAERFTHLDNVLKLARYPQVGVKVSALPCFATDPYPHLGLHPYLRRVYDAYGPQRMFWGSDMSRLPCSYRQAVTMFTEEMPFFSGEDKRLIMGQALCDFIGWDPDRA